MAKRGRRKKTAHKTAKQTARKKVRRRAGARTARRGRPSSLAGASVDQLKAELGRRVKELQSRRDELVGELAQIEGQISDLNGAFGSAMRAAAPARRRAKAGGRRAGAGSGAKRARNAESLSSALHKLLTGTTMSVTEMAAAVQKAGYKTKSAGNFRTIVNQTLIREPRRFKRVGRGQYTAK